MRGSREAILKAAMRIFAEKGYAGGSTREICQAAGVTRPMLYYHFRSKEHLYEELMIDCFEQFHKNLLRASNARGSLRQKLTRILWNDFRECREDPVRIQFILRMVFSPEEQRPHFNSIEEMERQRQVIAGVLQEAVEAGEVRGNARDVATLLMGMSLITILEHVFTGRPTLTRRNAEKYVDVLLRGCAPNRFLPTGM